MYRTRTYLAADWSKDIEVIEKLRQWNNSNYLSLSFTDAHELKQAKDTSRNCNIKRSLQDRLNASKNFVLIVGHETKNLRAGGCQLCKYYLSSNQRCYFDYNSIDYRSFIEYECEKAIKDNLKIVVIYNYANVDKQKCPEVIKNVGKHIPAYHINWRGNKEWNYISIKEAIMK